MMEKLRNPKNVKTISLIVAAIFVIGCFTLAMSAGGFGSAVASAASSESAIGVVNYQVLVSQSPSIIRFWSPSPPGWNRFGAICRKRLLIPVRNLITTVRT